METTPLDPADKVSDKYSALVAVVNDTNGTYYIDIRKLPDDCNDLGEVSIWLLKKVV